MILIKPENKDQNELADKLIKIAEEIRGENPDGVFRAVIVLDGKNSVQTIRAGAKMRTFDVVGLLEFSKLMVIKDASDGME